MAQLSLFLFKYNKDKWDPLGLNKTEPLKFTTYGSQMFSLSPQMYLYSSLFISNVSF